MQPLPVVSLNKLVNLAEQPTQPRKRLSPFWLASLSGSLCPGTIATIVYDRTVCSAAAVEGTRDVVVLAELTEPGGWFVSPYDAGGIFEVLRTQLDPHELIAAGRSRRGDARPRSGPGAKSAVQP